MEEKFIRAKHLKGYITEVVVSPTSCGWVVEFIEDEKDEQGYIIRHHLTLQRGSNNREFKSLDAVANTLRRMNFKRFQVNIL